MKKVLVLALYCILGSAEERPTMMEVAKQLKQIQRFASLLPSFMLVFVILDHQ